MEHVARSFEAIERLLPPVYDMAADLSDLPRDLEAWPCAQDPVARPRISRCLEKARRHGGWHWPDRPVVFLSDPHADAEGFLRSLVVAGAIRARP